MDGGEFSTMMNAAKGLLGKLQTYIENSTSTDGFKFGLASFADTSATIIGLTNNYTDLINAINNNTQATGLTNLSAGLDTSYTLATESGKARNVNKKIVIYTDGAPTLPGSPPQPENDATNSATTIKNSVYNSVYRTDIIVIGIGVTSGTATYLSTNIASVPSLYFDVANFASLESLNASIANRICEPPVSPTPTPTPSRTPSVTPPVSPSSTPSITPSVSPAPACTCYLYRVFISQSDIDAAFGNTGGLAQYNGVVILDYTDCNGVSQQLLYETPQEEFSLCACSINNSSPYYYSSDLQNNGFSYANFNGACD